MGKKLLMTEGKHDKKASKCNDCFYNEMDISCWCTSNDAFNLRQTKQCGMENCPFWEPCLHIDNIKKPSLLDRLFNNPLDKYEKIKGI